MRKTLRSDRHQVLLDLLKDARLAAGLTQADVALRLGKPQSFVAKYEGGERRLDVVEFVQIAHALNVDPARLIVQFGSKTAAATAGER